jgi:hypothetical protein
MQRQHAARCRVARQATRRRLRVIAVHLPRSEADEDVEEVRAAISENNIMEPCAIDNERKLRDAFQNEKVLCQRIICLMRKAS